MSNINTVKPDTNKKGLAQVLQSLDEKSRSILSYLWWRRHAEISELRDIADSMDDSEVLYRLKEIINKKSQDIFGRPIVCFEQSKIDPLNGEKILFSWWYMDEEDELITNPDPALMDVFNEKDNITIIAQLPAAVDLTAPEIQYKNGILRIKFRKSDLEKNN